MRGIPNLNKEMFTLVAGLLRDKGFTVFNPSEHGSYLRSSFASCMTTDINAIVNRCNKIALLPSWKDSLGANTEAFVAFVCGMEAVEVTLNETKTDIDLLPFDLSNYRLPYGEGEACQFDPHDEEL